MKFVEKLRPPVLRELARAFGRRLRSSVAVAADRLWLPTLWNYGHGLCSYLRTGETPESGRRSMVELFCKTNGWSNDIFHRAVQWWRPPVALSEPKGVLGDLRTADVARLASELHEKGYVVFPSRLTAEMCDRLYQLGRSARANAWPATANPEPRPFDPHCVEAATYFCVQQDLVNHPDYQAIMSDPSLIALAQAYLGCRPVLGGNGMWWSPAFEKKPNAQAAQLYHFDMDRIKWLRIFVYLTDVGQDNGPHCFVAGSHRPSRTTAELLKLGHTRIPDAIIEQHYRPEAILEFTAPRGTIIAEDTRGFHKGKAPVAGLRLIMELDFVNCLFGGPYNRPDLQVTAGTPLADMIARYPDLYRRFRIHHTAPATSEKGLRVAA